MSRTIKDYKHKFQFSRKSDYWDETDKKICVAKEIKVTRKESKQICKKYLNFKNVEEEI